MRQEFKLFYKDKFIGTVLTEDNDFPGTSGKFEFNLNILENENDIKAYIDFSVAASERVLGDNKTYVEFIDKEENKHKSIIDSLEWTLISKDGIMTKILAPVFFHDNGINMRFQ